MKNFLKYCKKFPRESGGFTPTPISRNGSVMKMRNGGNDSHTSYHKVFGEIGVSLQGKRGFTLVELLVVFFIMASILAVIAPDYFAYSSKLDLENLALDVALTIREAQAYGSGARVNQAGTSFDTAYGVHFEVASPNSFIFFENTSTGDNVYTPADTILNTYSMKSDYLIRDLCGSTSGGGEQCDISGGVKYLDIIFKRPNPGAIITISNNGGNPIGGLKDTARVEIISPDGGIKNIKVSSFGAISITN